MKVVHIYLENFKRFSKLDIPILNSVTGEVAEQFLILGDNGSGKTTALQAVALCLSMASYKTPSIDKFDWMGWLPGRYRRWGQPVIELEVHFTPDEIEATREAARRWFNASPHRHDFVEPGDDRVIRLRLVGEAFDPSIPKHALFQFQGRWYATQLLETDPSARELFERLPGEFWFDQFRNLASSPPRAANGEQRTTDVSFKIGVARLREFLNRWQLYRLTKGPGKRDYLMELENGYKRIFPGRSFSGPEPMFRAPDPTPSDYYFMLSDGNRTYDIEEMSAGEQAVFPILYEFVRLRIRNSVVLIDEIDLNLHPPLAQALLAALPVLGPNCQFLFTTHAEAITSVMSPAQIHRLPGGRLCL
jgi:predicted ATP-dependent endonuclease of OLD family